MNEEHLLAHYERIAEAPGAIARLRRFVLDLAVRGKLVGQDARDEPAAELLRHIREEKARLAKSGNIRKPKAYSEVDKPPFVLPQNWCWTRIREVTTDRGQTVPGSQFTYIDVTAIDKQAGVVAGPKVLEASDAPSRARKLTQKGDVIYSCVRPYLLNVAVIDDEYDPPAIASTAFAILNGLGFVHPRFLWIALRSPFMVELVEENQRGQAYPAINDADFAVLPFPLPPLAEQHRIVAKVDELMALCDRLEEARKEREVARDRLTAASLACLNVPDPDPATFTAHARFALDHLPALTTRADQIKQLRQTILNLAVRGKLVEQRATEQGPRLPSQKARASAEGKIAFEIPESWSWALVSEVATSRLGKMLDKAKNRGEQFPYLRNTNVHWFEVRAEDTKDILLTEDEIETYLLQHGDVLICEGGHGIGRTAVWRGEVSPMTFQKALHRVRPGEYLNADFFAFCCFVYFHEGVMETYFTGVGIPHFTGKALAKLLFPLPPLAEQNRIVAKVDELMALSDRLETCLTAGDEIRQRLLEVVLHEALEPVQLRALEAA